MNAFDTRGWGWDHSDYSAEAVGDSGPWVRWLPLAWRAAADPTGAHPLPPPPDLAGAGDVDFAEKHAEIIAWWAPLLHLLFFRLGWVRPDLGLARWNEAGQPDDNSTLRVVKRWWGSQVTQTLAWAGHSHMLSQTAATISESLGSTLQPVALPDRWAEERRSAEWEKTWGGGGDSMHLNYHVRTPVPDNPHLQGVVLATDLAAAPRATLVVPQYEGWYHALSQLGASLPVRADGRSWQVDVVVKPLGWLGSYRLSSQTGRWFSGRHRWHQMGVNAPL